MANINDVCDYIIFKTKIDEDLPLNHLKIQKLLYYVQAWHLAFFGRPFFDDKFQAWVHGPVSKIIYDRFKSSKSLYSEITKDDITNTNFLSVISEDKRLHIHKVLEVYMPYSGAQLELMSHKEQPWIKAREGVPAHQYCENEIDETVIESFFKQKLS